MSRAKLDLFIVKLFLIILYWVADLYLSLEIITIITHSDIHLLIVNLFNHNQSRVTPGTVHFRSG